MNPKYTQARFMIKNIIIRGRGKLESFDSMDRSTIKKILNYHIVMTLKISENFEFIPFTGL